MPGKTMPSWWCALILLDEKFEQGKAWTSVFVHKEQDIIKLLVRGDDFFVLADQEGQDYGEVWLQM